jgi:hypothetical protein
MSRSWLRPFGTFDLVFWPVVWCVSVIAVVRALGDGDDDDDDDDDDLLISSLLLLTSSVRLVRIFHARRERTGQANDQPLP